MSEEKPATEKSAVPEKPPESTKSKLRKRWEEEEEDKIDIASLPEMSVEDVDAFLDLEAPEFVDSVKNIAGDRSLSYQEISIDSASSALHAEIDLWKSYRGWRRNLYKLFPFAPHVSLQWKNASFRAKAIFQARWIIAKNFAYYLATDGRKQIFRFLLSRQRYVTRTISEALKNFAKLKRTTKFIFFLGIALLLASGLSLYLSYKGKLIPEAPELFLTGFSQHASESFEYDLMNDVEPYIKNARVTQNLYLTPRIVVNLKKSEQSGPNPMGAFEFFVEGMSSEVILEIKDREALIRDQMQTAISEFTFEQLDTKDGKLELCDQLQRSINHVLTTGKVRNVRLKTIVIKP